MVAYKEAVETFNRARNPERGKPVEHNVRFFSVDDGIAIQYHATYIVIVHPDGTYTLNNGGWFTVTTLQKIRAYTNAHLFSEKGNWYVRLQPDPDDPQPDYVDRKIPKPYTPTAKVYPGSEPVKTDDGFITFENNKRVQTYTSQCIAGTTEEYSYVSGNYKFHGKSNGIVNVYQGYGIYGDYLTWHNGRFYYGETQYEPYNLRREQDYTDYKQCPHCKAYDAIKARWNRLMHGDYWSERRFDQNTGWAKAAEMLRRFDSYEHWQQAYIEDFRARREYLKVEREWDQRNRVAFYDGLKIDSNGYALRSQHNNDLKFQRKLLAYERKAEKMRKRIDAYVKGYIETLKAGMPMPSGGDCWYCLMFDAQPPNEPGARRAMHRGSTVSPVHGNHEHLLSHISKKERYYVPSLAVNALRERGYQDVAVYMWLDMNPDENKMGKPDGRYDSVSRDIKTYLRKRLVPAPPSR